MSLSAAMVGSVTVPRWNPSRLGPEVRAWFDASRWDTVTIGSGSTSVARWADLSGNGFHAVQGADAQRPQWLDRSRMAFSRAAGSHFAISTMAGVFPRCVAAVINVTWVPGEFHTILGTQFQGFEVATVGALDGHRVQVGLTGVAGRAVSQGTIPDGVPALVLCNGTLAEARMLAGGVESTAAYAFGAMAAGAACFLGASEYGGAKYNAFRGDIHEIVVCNPLPVAGQHLLEGYLAHRWGLAAGLPIGHPYRNEAP